MRRLTTAVALLLVLAPACGSGGDDDEAAERASDPQAFLTDFLETWQGGDRDELRDFATDEALAEFGEESAGWERYVLHWNDECALRDSRGECSFSLIALEGGGFSFDVTYRVEQSGERDLVIDGFEPLGGGA